MSIEELQSDAKSIDEAVAKLGNLTSTSDLVDLIKLNLWPFVQAQTAEMVEMDEAINEVAAGLDDKLSEETAGIILAPLLAAKVLIAAFKGVLPPTATEQMKAIKEWERACKRAEEEIDAITIADYVDPDDEDADGEEDDEDEDDAQVDATKPSTATGKGG